jgi:hypothetical protein
MGNLCEMGRRSSHETRAFSGNGPLSGRPDTLDVPLDLQAIFVTVYARAHYAASVDYTRPVAPPLLRPALTAWIAAQVQAWHAVQRPAEP